MSLKLLEQLSLTAGVPGREHRVRDLIIAEVSPLVDSVSVDPMGNVLALRLPTPAQASKKTKTRKKSTVDAMEEAESTRVMLASHMDQIGFLVNFIDEKGFLRLIPVGGFDTRNLFARLVNICPDVNDPSKDFPGVLNPAGKPVHVASQEERKKVPEVGEFFVDTGLPAEEVNKRVKIGAMVVLQAPCTQMGDAMVGQAMDNRVACWIAIEALRKLKGKKVNCEVACVFTVQEEVGLRGAQTSAFSVEPDIGIGIDTTLCIDTPGVASELRVTEFGGGAALTMMDSSSIGDIELIETVEKAGQKAKVKMQRSIMNRGGTDTAWVQRAGGGCKAFTLSCPTRYIHTVTEMVHVDDLNACRDLLTSYLKVVK